MDGVWQLNAPQWTDFQSSPQLPDDDYFEREHEEPKPQPVIDKVVPLVPAEKRCEKNKSKLKSNLLEVPGKNDSIVNETEIAKMTPVKVISPTTRNKKNYKEKETTYDNVLSEAMASLQLSVKKKSRRSQNVRNTLSNLLATPTNADKIVVGKVLGLNKGPRSTPSNPIPMWIRKTRPSENNIEEDKTIASQKVQEAEKESPDPSPQDASKKQDPEIDENDSSTEPEEPNCIDTEPNTQDLATSDEPKAPEDSNKLIEDVDFIVKAVAASTFAPHPGPSKRSSTVSQGSIYSSKGQQPRFSTCQLRRRSLTQYRRRSNKYVSLAEAISKFQNKTPVRFRTVSLKNSKPGPLQKVRQSSISATVPISPALRCKTRTRPTVLSKEERDRLELEEIRKHSVRENLARSNSTKSVAQNLGSKINAKKPGNVSETSHLMEPKNQNVNKVNRESRMRVTVVPSVVSTDNGIAVKDAEISSFGVPDITINKPTTTKMMPFSFETRNKELQKKKEKKIKELMTEEEKKIKVPFHARPVPTFKKPMMGAAKETNVAKAKTKPCPFSFEERDKNLMKKKENFIKTVIEEDKKARIFQAKPIPEFKPVLVRGVSKENVNSGNNKPLNPPLPQKSRISMLPVSKTGSRNCLLVKTNVSNQENQNPLPKLERSKSQELQKTSSKVLAEFHLNTDKRAKERREFDDRIKLKEQEIELLRKEAEAEKMKRDELERAEIRRMAETKARPMPAYKLPAVIHSDKPLTEPQSPGWSGKPKR